MAPVGLLVRVWVLLLLFALLSALLCMLFVLIEVLCSSYTVGDAVARVSSTDLDKRVEETEEVGELFDISEFATEETAVVVVVTSVTDVDWFDGTDDRELESVDRVGLDIEDESIVLLEDRTVAVALELDASVVVARD